jgi:hypothetical protein
MSLADNALVTLDDAKTFLQKTTDKDVGILELLINGVSQEFDRFCGRILKQATTTALYLDGNGEKILDLPNWPAADLGTVTEDGTLLTEGDDDDYILYSSDDSAYLYRVSGVWMKKRKSVLISTADLGFSPIPADIQLACLKQCAKEFQTMALKGWGETSRSGGDGSVSVVEPGLLKDVEAVLRRYRRYGI